MAIHMGTETMAKESICGNLGSATGAAGARAEEEANGRVLRARGSVIEKTKDARNREV